MKGRWMVAMLAGVSLLGAQGCAALGLTLLGVGGGVTAGTGVYYSLDSVAYKTFTEPVETVEDATLRALERMDIDVKDVAVAEPQDEKAEMAGGARRTIAAAAGDRTIEIELEALTTQTTRMRVNAKQGVFFKDRATATEIIVQTEKMLAEPQMVAEEKTRP